ncbi:hypothetical protein DL240_09580 [Lujinxingia litoralis]|uniref:Outer membrane protein beta-barrel domain-containing protein n=2 Tax=Lujinxingia litoralis TaxID=2211119 RepID=A0A328CBG0_9DELT|nr:hypothetical protein DL240_09580 [Lujinxingia litoralis]
MRWTMVVALLLLVAPLQVWAQEEGGPGEVSAQAATPAPAAAPSAPTTFVGGTALLVEEGRWELGLFGPLRYGLIEKVELATHPLWFFVAPNLQAKFNLGQRGRWHLASKAQLTYPTPLLRLLSREGIGGILPSDRAVPHLVSLQAELLATRAYGEHLLTYGLGVQVLPRVGASEMVSIDLPFVYPRTAAAFGWATGIAQVQAQGPIYKKLGYQADVRAFVYPGIEGAFAVEQGAGLRLTTSERFMAQAGYRFSYAGYPFGTMTNIAPTVELAWGF